MKPSPFAIQEFQEAQSLFDNGFISENELQDRVQSILDRNPGINYMDLSSHGSGTHELPDCSDCLSVNPAGEPC